MDPVELSYSAIFAVDVGRCVEPEGLWLRLAKAVSLRLRDRDDLEFMAPAIRQVGAGSQSEDGFAAVYRYRA